MKKKPTESQSEFARAWGFEFFKEELQHLPPQIRNNIDWDLVAADLRSETGEELSHESPARSPDQYETYKKILCSAPKRLKVTILVLGPDARKELLARQIGNTAEQWEELKAKQNVFLATLGVLPQISVQD